jgi:hypothetical protein
MASRPSAVRQRETTFPTPLIGDVLFTERVIVQTRSHPVYGTAHPDSTRWPNHKFVYAKERGEQDVQDAFDYYYAADRANQDSYNWAVTKADIGGTKFDSVVRTYVTPRSSFSAVTPVMGASMSSVPAGMSGTFVLAERRQTKIGEQELDSLYVFDTQVFVKKVTLGELSYDSKTGRATSTTTTLYYSGETVTGGSAIQTLFAQKNNAYWGLQSDGVFRTCEQLSDTWFAVIERSVLPESPINSASNSAKTRVINRNTPLSVDLYFTEIGAMPNPIPTYGSPHYDTTNWPNHRLLLITPADDSGLLYKFHYAADRANEDLYNWEITTGEQLIRTYLREKTGYSPSAPSTVPTADTRFSQYGFADETIVEAPEELRSRYVVLKRRFLEPIQRGVVWDDTMKSYVDIVKTLVPAGSITSSSLPSTPTPGVKIEVQNGNTFHDVKIEKILPEGSRITRLVDEYPSIYDKKFPAYLDSVSIKYAYAWATSSTHAPSFSEDYFFDYKIREARQGPYAAKILRYVTPDPDEVKALHPLLIMPQPIRETVAVMGWWYYASTAFGNQTYAVAKEIVLPATIHQSITVGFDSEDPTPPSLGELRSIRTTSLDPTPNISDLLNADDEVPMDYDVRALDYNMYEVSVVVVDLRDLYVDPEP